MSHLGRVVQGVLGDDVDGTAYGRCAIEGRATASYHLHALYHVGRNLLQTVHSGQGGEDRARIDEDLRVVAVQTIDAYLCETAVLAIVLGAHTGLEVKPLCQTGGLGGLELLAVQHVHQVGCFAALCLAAVGGNHHLVQRYVVGLHDEVHLACLVLADDYLACDGTESGVADLQGDGILGQVLEEIVSGAVGHGGDGGSEHAYYNVRKMLLLVSIDYVPDDVGIGVLVVGPYEGGGKQ